MAPTTIAFQLAEDVNRVQTQVQSDADPIILEAGDVFHTDNAEVIDALDALSPLVERVAVPKAKAAKPAADPEHTEDTPAADTAPTEDTPAADAADDAKVE